MYVTPIPERREGQKREVSVFPPKFEQQSAIVRNGTREDVSINH